MPATSIKKVQLNKKVSLECLRHLQECSFHLNKKTNEIMELALSELHHSVVVRGEKFSGTEAKLDEILHRLQDLGEGLP